MGDHLDDLIAMLDHEEDNLHVDNVDPNPVDEHHDLEDLIGLIDADAVGADNAVAAPALADNLIAAAHPGDIEQHNIFGFPRNTHFHIPRSAHIVASWFNRYINSPLNVVSPYLTRLWRVAYGRFHLAMAGMAFVRDHSWMNTAHLLFSLAMFFAHEPQIMTPGQRSFFGNIFKHAKRIRKELPGFVESVKRLGVINAVVKILKGEAAYAFPSSVKPWMLATARRPKMKFFSRGYRYAKRSHDATSVPFTSVGDHVSMISY